MYYLYAPNAPKISRMVAMSPHEWEAFFDRARRAQDRLLSKSLDEMETTPIRYGFMKWRTRKITRKEAAVLFTHGPFSDLMEKFPGVASASAAYSRMGDFLWALRDRVAKSTPGATIPIYDDEDAQWTRMDDDDE